MDRHDNPYNLFDLSKVFVRIRHLHPGNSTKKQRENSKYFSYLEVFKRHPDGTVKWDRPVMFVTAKCAKNDLPSRSVARATLRMKAAAVAQHINWE